MKFSQRIGITSLRKAIQIESIDEALRNSLWSILTAFYWESFDQPKFSFANRIDYISRSNLNELFTALWLHYFKKPIDTIPKFFHGNGNGLDLLRKYFFDAEWYEVYDFIEFVSVHGPSHLSNNFKEACNKFLKTENSGYRFVNGKIIEISSSDEVFEIEKALEESTPFYGVKQHLSGAISLLSDKQNPDYRNSIKESISAVEALCKKISNEKNATLGSALRVLEKKGKMHPALKAAFSSLYGYTNDADGIRHALIMESNLTKADARFMLISCSAFINYIIEYAAEDV